MQGDLRSWKKSSAVMRKKDSENCNSEHEKVCGRQCCQTLHACKPFLLTEQCLRGSKCETGSPQCVFFAFFDHIQGLFNPGDNIDKSLLSETWSSISRNQLELWRVWFWVSSGIGLQWALGLCMCKKSSPMVVCSIIYSANHGGRVNIHMSVSNVVG